MTSNAIDWNTAGILAIVLLGLLVMNTFRDRSPQDVLSDLKDNTGKEPETISDKRTGSASRHANDFHDAGLFDDAQRKYFLRLQKLLPFVFAVLFALARIAIGTKSLSGLIPAIVIGLSLGYLIARRRLFNKKETFRREIEFFLPIVMERLVMAVESGLDIIPAIRTIIKLEESPQGEIASSDLDPASRLLFFAYQMTEAGISFEYALREAAQELNCNALRHAFIHLALAQKEGGEVITPLRELSDSTQLYYQESVEEEIAKMPVKATLPLVLTFAGLIILFITSPLVQIMSITQSATPQSGGFSVEK